MVPQYRSTTHCRLAKAPDFHEDQSQRSLKGLENTVPKGHGWTTVSFRQLGLTSSFDTILSFPDKGKVNIFSLPEKIRKHIFQKVLYVPHPLYLFQDTGSRVETFAPDRPRQWLSLLYVNRQIHDEAAKILFGINNFTLLDERRPTQCLLNAFLTCIGPMNSASLSHLSIDFPALEVEAGEVRLKHDSLQKLKLLQGHCTNLKTVETSFSIKHIRDLDQVTGNNPQLIMDALSKINSQLHSISSLETVIVRITGPSPALSTMECMRTLGWTILAAY